VVLRPGVGHLAADMTRGLIVPLALEYPFWDERCPEVLLRFGAPLAPADQPGRPAAAWTQQLAAALEHTQDALAAAARRHDSDAFETLAGGTAGVGGVYGCWQRLRAWWQGQPYQPQHSPLRRTVSA